MEMDAPSGPADFSSPPAGAEPFAGQAGAPGLPADQGWAGQPAAPGMPGDQGWAGQPMFPGQLIPGQPDMFGQPGFLGGPPVAGPPFRRSRARGFAAGPGYYPYRRPRRGALAGFVLLAIMVAVGIAVATHIAHVNSPSGDCVGGPKPNVAVQPDQNGNVTVPCTGGGSVTFHVGTP
jgi:hypothetical protein